MLVSIGYFAMRYNALGFFLSDPNYVNHSTQDVLLTIPIVIWKYIGLMFAGFVALPADFLNLIGVPVKQVNYSIFHATPMVKTVTSIRFILPGLGLVALAVALWLLRKNLISRFAILWFLIHLLPVLNLNAFSADFLVQERYVYIPSIGFSLLMAQALASLPRKQTAPVRSRRMAEVALVAFVVIIFSGKTLGQNRTWKDDETLWTSGAQSASEQTMPHYIQGHRYLHGRRFDKAIEAFERFVEIDQTNTIVMNNLAACHLYMYELELAMNPAQADHTRVQRAISLCNDALKLARNAALYDTLGKAYTFTREFLRAHAYFDLGLKLQPNNPMLRMHKGATYLVESTPQTVMLNVDLALAQLEIANKVAPDLSDVYKYMAYAYMTKGMSQEAINNFNEYLRLQPHALDRSTVSKHIQDLSARLQTAPPNG
jgi:tetratricopeptide (TPR) repeat protein